MAEKGDQVFRAGDDRARWTEKARGGARAFPRRHHIRRIAGPDLAGPDRAEVSPPLDHAGITALAAAPLAHDRLCPRAEAAAAVQVPVGRL